MARTYEQEYERGWRCTAQSLDAADHDGRTVLPGWVDGYLDAAAGREKWHMRECRKNHGEGCSEHTF